MQQPIRFLGCLETNALTLGAQENTARGNWRQLTCRPIIMEPYPPFFSRGMHSEEEGCISSESWHDWKNCLKQLVVSRSVILQRAVVLTVADTLLMAKSVLQTAFKIVHIVILPIEILARFFSNNNNCRECTNSIKSWATNDIMRLFTLLAIDFLKPLIIAANLTRCVAGLMVTSCAIRYLESEEWAV